MSLGLTSIRTNEKVLCGAVSAPGNEVTTDILSFEFLPHGWNFGDGDPIKPNVIKKALEIHEKGLELGLLTEAIPEVDGGITLSFVHGEDSVDIRIHPDFPDFTYTVIRERGLGPEFKRLARKKRVNLSTALSYLYELKPAKVEYTICKSCEFLELGQSLGERIDLRLTRVSPTMVIAYPSSTWRAFVHEHSRFANTWRRGIRP